MTLHMNTTVQMHWHTKDTPNTGKSLNATRGITRHDKTTHDTANFSPQQLLYSRPFSLFLFFYTFTKESQSRHHMVHSLHKKNTQQILLFTSSFTCHLFVLVFSTQPTASYSPHPREELLLYKNKVGCFFCFCPFRKQF